MQKSHDSSKTISPIVLNQTHVVSNGGYNNVYRFSFPGSAGFRDAKVAISNI